MSTPSDPRTGRDDKSSVVISGWVIFIPAVLLTLVLGYFAGQALQRRLNKDEVAQAPPTLNPVDGMPTPLVSEAQPQGDVPLDILPTMPAGAAIPRSNHFLLGQDAPEIVMARLDSGEKLALSDLRGKTVMLNFWATWCPPCRYEMPWLINVYNKYKDQGFELLAVDAGEKVPPEQVVDRVKAYVNGMALPFPVLLDDNTYEVQRLYAVTGLPGSFIIDPQGKVLNHHGGMFPDEASAHAFVEEALALSQQAAVAP